MHAKYNVSSAPNGSGEVECVRHSEPTLGELLADPITRAAMRADRVDPAAFEATLRSAAGRVRAAAARNAKPWLSISGYLPWPSVGRLAESVKTRSAADIAAAKASKAACGSPCAW